MATDRGHVHRASTRPFQGLADIAGCASNDTSRQILNGVLFTPEDEPVHWTRRAL